MERANSRIVALAAALILAGPAAAGAADAAKVYSEICAFCHDDGTVGAPVKGDRAAWAPRIARGKPALYDSTLQGLGHMLPRQNRRGYGEAEIRDAVDYLLEQVR